MRFQSINSRCSDMRRHRVPQTRVPGHFRSNVNWSYARVNVPVVQLQLEMARHLLKMLRVLGALLCFAILGEAWKWPETRVCPGVRVLPYHYTGVEVSWVSRGHRHGKSNISRRSWASCRVLIPTHVSLPRGQKLRLVWQERQARFGHTGGGGTGGGANIDVKIERKVRPTELTMVGVFIVSGLRGGVGPKPFGEGWNPRHGWALTSRGC